MAFSDPDVLEALGEIVHPAVRDEMFRRVAEQAETDNVVILDIPLLAESGWEGIVGSDRGRSRSRDRGAAAGRTAVASARPTPGRGSLARPSRDGTAGRGVVRHRQLGRSSDSRATDRRGVGLDRRAAREGEAALSINEITRTERPFVVHSDFSPAGDQPEAIEALADGVWRGERFQTLSGHHRVGQVRHDRLDDRAGPATHTGHRAEQEPCGAAGQRVPRVLPRQPRRVLRLVLRLLPARGLHAVLGHLHREGRDGQRRDRPAPPLGQLGAADPARRDRRSRRSAASTASVRPTSTPINCSSFGWARPTITATSCADWSTFSTNATR